MYRYLFFLTRPPTLQYSYVRQHHRWYRYRIVSYRIVSVSGFTICKCRNQKSTNPFTNQSREFVTFLLPSFLPPFFTDQAKSAFAFGMNACTKRLTQVVPFSSLCKYTPPPSTLNCHPAQPPLNTLSFFLSSFLLPSIRQSMPCMNAMYDRLYCVDWYLHFTQYMSPSSMRSSIAWSPWSS